MLIKKFLFISIMGLSGFTFLLSQERGMKPVDQPFSEKRYALVIGNANYTQGKLKNPGNDAVSMTLALRKMGFDVVEEENLPLRKMEEAITTFGRKIHRGGVGLFYYAGHAIQAQGNNYLIPIGASITKEQDVKYEAVDVGRVLAEMDAAKNRLNIVILDACRDNPFSRSWRSSSAGKGLAAINDAPAGTIIAYATSPGKVAADGDGANGLYTQELLAQLQTPGLKIEDVFKRTRTNVKRKSNEQQIPWELSMLEGDFFFLPSSSKTPKEKVEAPQIEPTPVSPPKQTIDDNMVYVEGGWFEMGSNEGENDEKPVHRIYVDGFYIDKYEVTQAEYEKAMGSNPSSFKCPECPVENVSWDDAVAYAKKIGKRLPTEAEWEYAAKGGKLSKGFTYSGGNTIDEFGWYGGNSEGKTHRVGEKQANKLGIYDMSGNVWEWCSDWYDAGYYKNSSERNPQGPTTGWTRVLRGSSWLNFDDVCRVAYRFSFNPTRRNYYFGFRLVRTN